ncbi:hypothetical protein D3C87_1906580 [compost metagenome]
MKAKKKDVHNSVNQSDSEISAEVIAKLRKTVLFPEKIEETRKIFSNLKSSTL